MKDIIIAISLLILFFAPFVAIGWVIYRVVKGGNSGGGNSITGN